MLATLEIIKVAVVTVAILVCHWLMRDSSVVRVIGRMHWIPLGLVWAALLILLIMTQKSSNSFIYFQF